MRFLTKAGMLALASRNACASITNSKPKRKTTLYNNFGEKENLITYKKDQNGRTTLTVINPEGFELLINEGAGIVQESKNGWFPANNAAEKIDPKILKALTEARADLEISNNGGTSPMNIAARNGDVKIIRALRIAGIDLKEP